MKINEIVHSAIENLDPVLLNAEWQPFKNIKDGIDGELILRYEKQKIHFEAIVKKELRTYQVEKIIDQANQCQNLIVIIYSLYPA